MGKLTMVELSETISGAEEFNELEVRRGSCEPFGDTLNRRMVLAPRGAIAVAILRTVRFFPGH